MGLSSVLSTATTGLTAAETTIDVVGNNVANSNTVGFKASSVVFATQFLQTLGLGSAPTDTNGGTNPRQTGLGVQVAAVTPDFDQGTIQLSSSSTDFAIQGEGFFIIQGGQGEQLYTRNGVFQINASNELVTSTGERVLGYGVDENFQIQETGLAPISVPLGNQLVAQATSEVELTGNLSPSGDVATLSEVLESDALGDGSQTAPTTALTGAAAAAAPAAAPATGGIVTAASNTVATGLSASTTYTYKVVYVDDAGGGNYTEEGTPSATITQATGGSDDTITLSSLPVSGTLHMRIYRNTPDNPGTYYLIKDNLDLTSVTTWADTMPDATAELQQTLDTNTLTGEYTYYMTWSNASAGGNLVNPAGTESRPIKIGSSVSVTGQWIDVSNLEAPGAGWSTRRLYRNSSTSPNDFRLMAEFSGSGAVTYTDNNSDDDIDGNKALDFVGPRIASNTVLTDVLKYDAATETYSSVFAEGDLSLGVRKGVGSSKPIIATKTLEIEGPSGSSTGTKVSDLTRFMEDAMGILPHTDSTDPPADAGGTSPGVSITTDGRIKVYSNTGEYNAVQITNSDFRQTSNIDLGFNSTQAAEGAGAVTTFRVFDSLGTAINVRLTMALESRNDAESVYRWFADSADNSSSTGSEINIGTGLVRFDGTGRLQTGSTTDNVIMSILREESPADSPLQVSLDWSQVTGLATSTNTLAAPRTDGFPPGQLTGFLVGEDGTIKGVFDNGASRDLGQIRLARFANNSGLIQQGENAYAPGVNSGLPIEGNPGEQGIGSVIAGAQELSNTDIGKNLIDLILASTQYRGNTRVISAAQNLLDELLNLRR